MLWVWGDKREVSQSWSSVMGTGGYTFFIFLYFLYIPPVYTLLCLYPCVCFMLGSSSVLETWEMRFDPKPAPFPLQHVLQSHFYTTRAFDGLKLTKTSQKTEAE